MKWAALVLGVVSFGLTIYALVKQIETAPKEIKPAWKPSDVWKVIFSIRKVSQLLIVANACGVLGLILAFLAD